MTEVGNLDPGTDSVWQVIGTGRSDDYKYGCVLGGAGPADNRLAEGSIVRGSIGLAKLGDGSWIPVRKVFLDEVVQAVPDLVTYIRRVFPDAARSEDGPPLPAPAEAPRDDVRDRLGEDPGDAPEGPRGDRRSAPGPAAPEDGGPAPGPRGPEPEDDVRTLTVSWDEHGERYKAWREVVAESSRHEFAIGPSASTQPRRPHWAS